MDLEIVFSIRKLFKNGKIVKIYQKSFNKFLKISEKIKFYKEYIKKINNYQKKKNENALPIKNFEISYILLIIIFYFIKKSISFILFIKFNFNNIIEKITRF